MSNTFTSANRATKVLVFDSGVGGLSILQEIHQQFPECILFYASDNAAFPYGTKDEPELIERVDTVLHQLQNTTQADLIVVACNTASTVALPRIRERFSQPIVGVVPAIKPAAQRSQTKVIGLLATPGTVKRHYTQKLIEHFASDCEFIRVGSNELVHLAEKKLRGETISQEELLPIVAPLRNHPKIDTLVLACTHFPLLQEELQQALPNITHWVNSGKAIAHRVGYWIAELNHYQHIKQDSSTPEQVSTAYFTQQSHNVESLRTALTKFDIQEIKYL